ncbi:MAG TPA: hypothetical protein VF771_03465 [Longimicrobiaceae bacterium]
MDTKNRVKQEDPREEPTFGDFWTIEVRCDTYHVSAETAVRVGRMLDRFWRPRWTKFVDLYGRRVWVRTDQVEGIYESTEAQRSRLRAFVYARHKEEKADRRWDDDENW